MDAAPPQDARQKRTERLATAGMLLATIIWGWGFIFQKFALTAGLSPPAVSLGRMSLAALVTGLVFYKTIRRKYQKGQWKVGLLLGGLLYAGQLTQTIGMETTTPGNSAFITASYVVMVPLLYWFITRRRLSAVVVVACVMSLCGVGVLSLDLSAGLSVNRGDAITLVCAVIFAVQIVVIGLKAASMDPVTMAFLQFAAGAVLSLVHFLLAGESFAQFASGSAAISLLYLGVFSTSIGFTLQMVGQKHVSSAKVGIVLSCEALFGALFSVLVGYDTLSPRMVVGGLLVFVAVILPDMWLQLRLRALPAAPQSRQSAHPDRPPE